MTEVYIHGEAVAVVKYCSGEITAWAEYKLSHNRSLTKFQAIMRERADFRFALIYERINKQRGKQIYLVTKNQIIVK